MKGRVFDNRAELDTGGVHPWTGSGHKSDFTQSLRIGSGRGSSPNFPKFVLKIYDQLMYE